MDKRIEEYIKGIGKKDNLETTTKKYICMEIVDQYDLMVDNLSELALIIEKEIYDREEYLGTIKNITDSMLEILQMTNGVAKAKDINRKEKVSIEIDFKKVTRLLEAAKSTFELTAKKVDMLEEILEADAIANNRKELKISNIEELKEAKMTMINFLVEGLAISLVKDIHMFLQ